MLIRFRVANFRSLRDEQELSMVAASREGRTNLVEVEGLDVDLLRVAGIYGPNAAGKSNVLDALGFMCSAVVDSHRLWRPEGPISREPFLLDPAFRSQPSTFDVDFVVDGVSHNYGFKIDDEKVIEEWLYASRKGRRQVWLRRHAGSPEQFSFGKELKGRNRSIKELTRKNSLFLSAAAENNHQMLLPVYSWFATSVRLSSSRERASRESLDVRSLESQREGIIGLLKLADLGVVDFEIRSELRPTDFPLTRSRFEMLVRNLELSDWLSKLDLGRLYLKHKAKNGLVALPIEKESLGTQSWLSLAEALLKILRDGGVLCVDELDASLHPHLAAEAVRIFQDPNRNPRGAQLVFNTHDTTLLGDLLDDSPLLSRDQVWFVEKDDEGSTQLFPLTDFELRDFEDSERGYLQGRYGAIPFIPSQTLPENAQKD